MNATPQLDPLTRFRYRAQQAGIRLPLLGFHLLMRLALRDRKRPQPSNASLLALRERYEALLATDLANVDAGLYPQQLLFELPLAEYARALPSFLADVPGNYRRAAAGRRRELPTDVDLSRFPAYFRRNFHWQRDGYLSERSARVYDVGVELLFVGTADIMRRQLLPPIQRFRASRDSAAPLRVLDVACGTGRSLLQVAKASPRDRFVGVDLSPYYLREAQRTLRPITDVSLVADNAESLPFKDGSFDVVTSVFLFHELPRRARRNVLRELRRVVAPGGIVVLEDAAQLTESPALEPFLRGFGEDFNEPFFHDYIDDPLEAALAEVGLVPTETSSAFLSKVVAARPG